MHAYDYALIRVVPRVERGEFVNVGVVLSCKAGGFLEARIELDEDRLRALDPGVDLAAVRGHLAAFAAICAGGDGCRSDRSPARARTLPLADRAAQHDDPDLAGAQRPLRRSRGRDRAPARHHRAHPHAR